MPLLFQTTDRHPCPRSNSYVGFHFFTAYLQKKPIWKLPTYALIIAAPFIEGTELELGHPAQSCSVLGYVISKLIKDRTSRERLTSFSER